MCHCRTERHSIYLPNNDAEDSCEKQLINDGVEKVKENRSTRKGFSSTKVYNAEELEGLLLFSIKNIFKGHMK